MLCSRFTYLGKRPHATAWQLAQQVKMQFYHQQNAINFQVVTPNQARHQLGEPTVPVYNYNNVVLYTQQGNGPRDVRWRRTHESSKHGQTDSIVHDTRHEYSGCCSVHIIAIKIQRHQRHQGLLNGPNCPSIPANQDNLT